MLSAEYDFNYMNCPACNDDKCESSHTSEGVFIHCHECGYDYKEKHVLNNRKSQEYYEDYMHGITSDFEE